MLGSVRLDDGKKKIPYAVFGNGEKPFVILPGLSVKAVLNDADAIGTAFSAFCDAFTVYLIDRVIPAKEGITVEQMAEDTAATMVSLGISDAAVFGVSQGGMIAQCLTARHPELVGRLILASAAPGRSPLSDRVLDNWLKLAREGKAKELAAAFVSNVYSGATAEKYGGALCEALSDVTQEELSRFAVLCGAAVSYDGEEYLNKIACPTLVIGCEGDRVLGADASRKIAAKLSCESYFYGAEYGHAVYDEAPDYRDRVLAFALGDRAAEFRKGNTRK